MLPSKLLLYGQTPQGWSNHSWILLAGVMGLQVAGHSQINRICRLRLAPNAP